MIRSTTKTAAAILAGAMILHADSAARGQGVGNLRGVGNVANNTASNRIGFVGSARTRSSGASPFNFVSPARGVAAGPLSANLMVPLRDTATVPQASLARPRFGARVDQNLNVYGSYSATSIGRPFTDATRLGQYRGFISRSNPMLQLKDFQREVGRAGRLMLDEYSTPLAGAPVTMAPSIPPARVFEHIAASSNRASVAGSVSAPPPESGLPDTLGEALGDIDIRERAERSTAFFMSRAVERLFSPTDPRTGELDVIAVQGAGRDFEMVRLLDPRMPSAYLGGTLSALELNNSQQAMETWKQGLNLFGSRNGTLDDLAFDFAGLTSKSEEVRRRAAVTFQQLRRNLDLLDVQPQMRPRRDALVAYLTWLTGDVNVAVRRAREASDADSQLSPVDRISGIRLLYERLESERTARLTGSSTPAGN